ncbi:MAG TPA: hypothetical protein VN281_03130 [Verrucomicrobiae bacterium]|jgi:hypothetical protein|nr:hypothetical protein [Verrucomicrobiae bacterium]
MKPINKDEIYEHLSSFLKSRGIELKEGAYSRGIQQTCNFLADSINLSQEGVKRAKVEFDKSLDRMRQVIHERTAPRNGGTSASPGKTKRATSSSATSGKAKSTGKSKARKSQK